MRRLRFSIMFLPSLWCWRYHRKSRQEKGVMTEVTALYQLPDYWGAHKFTYNELSVATGNFSDKEMLGPGAFGRVYRGVLPSSNVVVAIKRMHKKSNQGAREVLAEVKILGRMSHRNLVPLLGWCYKKSKGELLLVYEYMPNGSLDKSIFGKRASAVILSWKQKKEVVIGLATALRYLHEECEPPVFHGDVKASSVMLDAECNARLGDFGLARLYDHSKGRDDYFFSGTPGYIAPEAFAYGGAATEKTDVYSFGVLALEIATGRRASYTIGNEKWHLVDWVWSQFLWESILAAADVSFGNDHTYNEKDVELVLQTGLLCCHPDPEERPPMRQILKYLKLEVPFPVDVLQYYSPSFASTR